MIHVHIESPSVEALQGELNALLSGINKGTIKDVVQAVPNAEVAVAPVEKVAEAPVVEEAARPMDTPHADPVGELGEPGPAGEPIVEADEAPVEKYPSMTDTRAVLNQLRAKKGPKAVKEILVAHGVNSFVDLDSADYAAVMAEAEEALNG